MYHGLNLVKYYFLFLKNLEIIHSVWESKINTVLCLLFMIQYFILPILLYTQVTDIIVAPSSRKAKDLSIRLSSKAQLVAFPSG